MPPLYIPPCTIVHGLYSICCYPGCTHLDLIALNLEALRAEGSQIFPHGKVQETILKGGGICLFTSEIDQAAVEPEVVKITKCTVLYIQIA